MTPLTPIPTQAHQILLPGQAAAPDGPIDMAPMYLMHHAFRRDRGISLPRRRDSGRGPGGMASSRCPV